MQGPAAAALLPLPPAVKAALLPPQAAGATGNPSHLCSHPISHSMLVCKGCCDLLLLLTAMHCVLLHCTATAKLAVADQRLLERQSLLSVLLWFWSTLAARTACTMFTAMMSGCRQLSPGTHVLTVAFLAADAEAAAAWAPTLHSQQVKGPGSGDTPPRRVWRTAATPT